MPSESEILNLEGEYWLRCDFINNFVFLESVHCTSERQREKSFYSYNLAIESVFREIMVHGDFNGMTLKKFSEVFPAKIGSYFPKASFEIVWKRITLAEEELLKIGSESVFKKTVFEEEMESWNYGIMELWNHG